MTSEFVYTVCSLKRCKNLKDKLLKPDYKDLGIFDSLEILYFSLNFDKARNFYQETKKDQDSGVYWQSLDVYLIKSKLDEEIKEGLINEIILRQYNYESKYDYESDYE